MSPCTKCGGAMKGPSYCAGGAFRCQHEWNRTGSHHMDHLWWRCETCGYIASGPTDAERLANADKGMPK